MSFNHETATKSELIERLGDVPGMNLSRMSTADLRALYVLINPSINARGSKERPGVGTTAKRLIVKHWSRIQSGEMNYQDIADQTAAEMLKAGFIVSPTAASVAVYASQLRKRGKITGYGPIGRPVFEDA